MTISGDPKDEKSCLLPQSSSISFSEDGNFSRESVEVEQMKKTTHNDPVAVLQDMHNLYGSTRILRTSILSHSQGRSSDSSQHVVDATARRRKRKSSMVELYKDKKRSAVLFLEKVKTNFFEDARSLAEGTIPQSFVLAVIIGIVCGVACWLYSCVMESLLELLWKTLPEKYVEGHWEVHNYWLWIPLIMMSMSILVGLTVVYMGEPGDLPYTISRVHHHAFIPMDHIMPMAVASLFSILAGGALGPEAPLVAICGALGGFISRNIFRQKYINVIRKHTLMGMSGALAAFFGVPLGGSLFALEVCSRFGVEYFEHIIESIFCGEICLVVFRSLAGLKIRPIWDITREDGRIEEIEPWLVLVGGFIGLVGAFLGYIFATFHWANMSFFAWMQILDNARAIYRAIIGGAFIAAIAVMVPHTMFWGEEEIQIIANMLPAKELPNVWPTTGYTGFEMDSAWTAFIVGIAKLVSISFTVAAGLRGGFIFPLMSAGAAIGRVVHYFLPDCVPVQVCVLCTAAGLNVAITRTALASTLILAFLAGEPCAIPPILMASLCSLFATAYLPFIKTQITRSDIDHSLFHEAHTVGECQSKLEDKDDEEDGSI